MSRILRVPAAVLILALLFSAAAVLADEAMLPVDVDSDSGRVLLEIRSFDEPLIYTNTLATGLGTPSPLLDRGDTGDSALVVFERHGDRVPTMLRNELARSEISEHTGSCFDDFLEDEDLLAETEAAATKRVIAWQIEQSSFPTC